MFSILRLAHLPPSSGPVTRHTCSPPPQMSFRFRCCFTRLSPAFRSQKQTCRQIGTGVKIYGYDRRTRTSFGLGRTRFHEALCFIPIQEVNASRWKIYRDTAADSPLAGLQQGFMGKVSEQPLTTLPNVFGLSVCPIIIPECQFCRPFDRRTRVPRHPQSMPKRSQDCVTERVRSSVRQGTFVTASNEIPIRGLERHLGVFGAFTPRAVLTHVKCLLLQSWLRSGVRVYELTCDKVLQKKDRGCSPPRNRKRYQNNPKGRKLPSVSETATAWHFDILSVRSVSASLL